jgi:uncharacterized protein
MSLYDDWNALATKNQEGGNPKAFWSDYFAKEKKMYEDLLTEDNIVEGTVQKLAERYSVDKVLMTGFITGINDSLRKAVDLEKLDDDTVVKLDYDRELLYYNMVAAKAKWLYELPQWEKLLPEDRRKELYKKQKLSNTVIKGEKIGRNDPCPCGSGKKYKKCCGR